MCEPKKIKKASDEQKEYLLTYMEENIDFAQDRLESADGAHLKATKWQMLTTNLNAMRGARKDINQWRKYWRDQKIHAKERDALIKASFKRSAVNEIQQVKQLSPFDERLVALLATTAISGADVPELFMSPQGQAEMRTIATPSQSSQPIETPEDKDNLLGVLEASNVAAEMCLTSIADEMPVTAVAAARRPRKRKRAPSGKQSEISSFEEKVLEIEDEKLVYIKKCYEVQEKSFNWKKEYEGKLLELREREVSLQEKEFKFKMKNVQ